MWTRTFPLNPTGCNTACISSEKPGTVREQGNIVIAAQVRLQVAKKSHRALGCTIARMRLADEVGSEGDAGRSYQSRGRDYTSHIRSSQGRIVDGQDNVAKRESVCHGRKR